jgi:hypothetical protein
MSTSKKVEGVNGNATKKASAGETPPWDTEWAAEKAAEALRYLGRNYPECLENVRVRPGPARGGRPRGCHARG